MTKTPRRLIVLAIVALCVPFAFAKGRAAGRATTPPEAAKRFLYETSQLEFYLGDDGIAYIRPGVKIRVAAITDVAPGKKPVVEVFFTDDFDQPLDRLGKITPGVISASFVLAWYDPATREYTSHTTRTVTTPANSPRPGTRATQAAADSGGTWTDLEMGHAKYTFGTTLPASFDQSKVHTLGIYSTRNLTDILGKNYYVNVERDFRPDGQAVVAAETWDKIQGTSMTCNNCHDPLSAHGGSRRDLKLCILCHSPQTIDPDTGLSMDMEILTHKIHAPGMLKEPYVIWGNQQSIHDYSHVTFPQDVRNCDNCHEGITAAQKATQSQVWFTNPTRDACGSCHDEVNFATGEGHHGVPPQTDDSQCAKCHIPDSGEEWDASIKGAHTIPVKSKQLAGVNVAIVSVANMGKGKTPTVAFKITDDKGNAIDGSKLSTFAPILAGPTKSYTKYYRENGLAKAQFDATSGNTLYTFTAKVPDDATGTWTISGDFYKTNVLKRANGGPDITNVRDAAFNPIKYVGLDGATAVEPRRTVATTAQCNTCHDQLALHGGQRQNVDECVICHNPTMTDQAQRPAEAGTPEAISFQYLIHRIHTGHELERDFTVYGNGRSRHNYNEVTYPGDRRNCAKCHVGTTYVPPTPGDAVVTPRDYFSPMGSGTAACLGCHDSRDAAAHAKLNTTEFGGQPAEACGTCHGLNATWSASKVHAR